MVLCGHVEVADIGIPVPQQVQVLTKPRFAAPGPDSHKYKRGMVGIVGGSMPGAASLAVSAASRLAGYTVMSGDADAPHAVVRRSFEQMLADKRLGAVLIGPGLGGSDAERAQLAAALAHPVPLVIDAGGLALLETAALGRPHPTILTPHEGEFVALFGALPGSKIDRASQAAATSGAVIIYKGADSVIAAPDGRIAVAPCASGWLASAGTGDVLAGITAALLSGGRDPFEAACAAVWLHGEAARLAGPALVADDLASFLPFALESCL